MTLRTRTWPPSPSIRGTSCHHQSAALGARFRQRKRTSSSPPPPRTIFHTYCRRRRRRGSLPPPPPAARLLCFLGRDSRTRRGTQYRAARRIRVHWPLKCSPLCRAELIQTGPFRPKDSVGSVACAAPPPLQPRLRPSHQWPHCSLKEGPHVTATARGNRLGRKKPSLSAPEIAR